MQHLDEYGATRRFAGGPQQGGSGPVHVRDELLYGRDAGQASSPSQPTVNASAHLYSGYAALPAPTVSLWGVIAVGHALIALPSNFDSNTNMIDVRAIGVSRMLVKCSHPKSTLVLRGHNRNKSGRLRSRTTQCPHPSTPA